MYLYMYLFDQEDQLLGNLMHFLDEKILSEFDTISPLGEPKRNAGPFMIYRNSRYVNTLYRRSADIARVVSVRIWHFSNI